MSWKYRLFLFAFLGTGCLFRSIQLCVFDTPHIESADVEEGGIKGSSKGWKLAPTKFFSNKHQALILCSWFAIVIHHLGCPTRAHSDTDLWRAPSWWLSHSSEIHKLSVPSICKSFTCFSCSISLYIIHSPATPHCTPLQVFLFVLFKYYEQLVSIWGP